MTQAKWIWYPGDFEIYHSMLLHERRQEFGSDYPCMWHISRPEYSCYFYKTVSVTKETTFTVQMRGHGFVNIDSRSKLRSDGTFTIAPGQHSIAIGITNINTFPALYINGGELITDSTWSVRRMDVKMVPAACDPVFTSPDDDPAVFPFSYEHISPAATEETDGGILYDFGQETYGPVTVIADTGMGDIFLCYGESREEALDPVNALVRETVPAFDGVSKRPCRAFRYLFVKAATGTPAIKAELEYIPLPDIAAFSCDDEKIADIWRVCVHTFHLNSREFYLDGIKRDRWCWSGDAYQSYIANRYLYFNNGMTRRTIRALLGKQPYLQHINTINDYSAYLVIGLWEYYFATGDRDFVQSVWDDVSALYRFTTERLDPATGYMVQREGDWIFIDWADIDKDGPLCAEQILLWQMHNSMANLADVLGLPCNSYMTAAEALKNNVMRDFWDEERSAFIDSYTSGKRNITRHANIFAVMYDFVDGQTQKRITESVLKGDIAKPITTPYFKFFELFALSKMGEMSGTQEFIDAYWGGMISLGATSVWEQFDPNVNGIEHYAMYGMKFGCSLCHAWGSGPIALLGMFCAGVRPTSVGYTTFDIAPNPGKYRQFTADVPVNGGTVHVEYRDGTVSATSTVPGGTLHFGGKSVPVTAGKTAILSL